MNTRKQAKRRAVLIFVLNRSGVLNKVTMMIRHKMYNVDTLTVCATREPGISRITLTLREDSDARTNQVVKQLERMTEVISAKELDTGNSFWREVAIVKIRSDYDQLEELMKTFNLEVLDEQSQGKFVVQIAGTSQMITEFIDTLGQENVIEAARSGFTALEKDISKITFGT